MNYTPELVYICTTAVMNYYKLFSLNLLSYGCVGQKSEMDLTRLKIKM
jgi:hypothetical protein